MTKLSRIVVCYDTPNDKRRRKFVRILNEYGERVQYSIFECLINERDRKKMVSRFKHFMDQEEDRVSLYQLCSRCDGAVVRLGETSASCEVENFMIF